MLEGEGLMLGGGLIYARRSGSYARRGSYARKRILC